MEESSQLDGQQDLRVASASTSNSSAGERPAAPNNPMEQPLPPKDERILSVNLAPHAATTGPSRNVTVKPESAETGGALTTVRPHNSYSAQGQALYYGGFDNDVANWDEYSNYVNANNLQIVPPAMYNDNMPMLFHSAYGFDAPMAYGQFSPMASPMSPIMFDGQLYSSHQMPPSPSYFHQPVSPSMPSVTSAHSLSQMEQVTPGSSSLPGNNALGIYKFPGEYGFADPMFNQSNALDTGSYVSPMTSAALYSQPVGILGSYEQNMQASQQQSPYHGYGLASSAASTKRYPYAGPYRTSSYGSGSLSPWEAGRLNQFASDKGGRRERDRDNISISSDFSSDRNRGPRSSKPKSKNAAEENSSSGLSKHGAASAYGVHLDQYNRPDFVTSYEAAKFFIIKSFSEDNVHKSIKYNIWASTPHGNKKLDAAYQEAKELHYPVFLFFSVNASGQFCGVAEMVGPVDFENDADYWQQDRWSGQFPVRWHIIKDVPNSRFRHILLENNDNKPVTHSRDSQEVKLEHGLEMLKIFKDYDADSSILDDFTFYDEREKSVQEKNVRQRSISTRNPSPSTANPSVNQISDKLSVSLKLDENKDVPEQSKNGVP